MIWLSVISCVAASAFAIAAYCALRTARRAIHHTAILEALLTSASQRAIDIENELDALRGKTTALFSRVDQVCLRQARLESVAGKPGFNEAIIFAKRGADARKLIDTCGLSHGEARLVELLHGSENVNTSDPGPHGAIAVEAR